MQLLRTMSMMPQINLYTFLLLFTLRIVLFLPQREYIWSFTLIKFLFFLSLDPFEITFASDDEFSFQMLFVGNASFHHLSECNWYVTCFPGGLF